MTFQRFGVLQHGKKNVNILRRRGSGQIKMTNNIGSTFSDLPLTPTSEGVSTSAAVLVDLENVGYAFGISLLSFIETEIFRYLKGASDNGGHR